MILVAISACSDGVAPRAPTTLVSNVSSPLSARVGFAVVPPPSVTVKDDEAQPLEGVSVVFSITRGNGTLLGDSAVTNSEGIATVVSWRLGRVAGLNTLTATVSGLDPVTIDATGTPGEPWSMTKVAGDSQTIVSGASVPIPPAVLLRDVEGNPVPGMTVAFTGGDFAGSVVTNSDGIATFASWRPTRPGTYMLEATHTLVLRQTFRTTVLAGPPAIIIKAAGDAQTAQAGTAVSRVPEVTVRDANQNIIAGIPVVFTVESGGGTVVNGNQVTRETAGPSAWILGPPGPQVLRVTVQGLAPVFFTATSVAAPSQLQR